MENKRTMKGQTTNSGHTNALVPLKQINTVKADAKNDSDTNLGAA